VPTPPSSLDAALRDLGRRIHEIRRKRGLTQEQAASELAMEVTNFARIEQGRVNVTVKTLVRVARCLDVPLIEVFRSPRSRTVRPGRPRKHDP
jgi:transcriptional regulator with XRE-family HTH domain